MSSQKNFARDGLLWLILLDGVRPKKFSYTSIIIPKSPTEGRAQIFASKLAKRILIMPEPTYGQNSTLGHVLPKFGYGTLTASEKYPNTPNYDFSMTFVKAIDYNGDGNAPANFSDNEKWKNSNDTLQNLEKKLAAAGSGNPERITSWGSVGDAMDVKTLTKQVALARKNLQNIEKSIREEFDRPQLSLFATFENVLHLMTHIRKATEVYYESTGIEDFYVIIQHWPKSIAHPEQIRAAYFVIDAWKDFTNKVE